MGINAQCFREISALYFLKLTRCRNLITYTNGLRRETLIGYACVFRVEKEWAPLTRFYHFAWCIVGTLFINVKPMSQHRRIRGHRRT